MTKHKKLLIINSNEFNLNSLVLGTLKTDEDNNQHIEIRYKNKDKKEKFFIQSTKISINKELFSNMYKYNILDIESNDNIFKKFIKNLELSVLHIIIESYNNKKLNVNYNNQHKFHEYFKSAILINDKIRMTCDYNNISYYNYNKDLLSLDEFISNLTDNTNIYIIFNFNNIIFDTKLYYINYDIKQIQLCKNKPKIIDKISDYQFLINETLLETYNESIKPSLKNNKVESKHKLESKHPHDSENLDNSSDTDSLDTLNHNIDNNLSDSSDSDKVNNKLLDKKNILNQIMKDLESSS